MALFNHIVNLIFPAVCKQCGNPVSADTTTACFCNSCWDTLKWFDCPCCPRCGLPYNSIDSVSCQGRTSHGHLCGSCRENPLHFDKAISAGPYTGVLAEAIKLFKYRKKIHIGRALTEWAVESTTTWFSDEKLSLCIIPVPLYVKRLREREFNQSVIIASVLSERLGVSVVTDALIKLCHTRPQVELGRKDRNENVAGVFSVCKGTSLEGKDIILVDDVYTTGSTVNECAKVLKKHGAAHVSVFTIGRMVE